MPVLEEWYDGGVSGHRRYNRPRACGVVGCNAHLATRKHLLARLCNAHFKCPAVLRGGVPQRCCAKCGTCHALEAFSGSLRCAADLRWERVGHPQD